jgi:hypothetical protein
MTCLTRLTQTRVIHLGAMLLEHDQAYKGRLAYHPISFKKITIRSPSTMVQENQQNGPLYTLVRTKMNQLEGGDIPQDVDLSDFPKNKLHKLAR